MSIQQSTPQPEPRPDNPENDFHTLFESMPYGAVFQNQTGEIVAANRAAEQILGLSLAQMQGLSSSDPRWRAFREDHSDLPGEEHPAMVALRTGQPVENFVLGVFNPQLNQHRWLRVNATPQFRAGQEKPYQVYALFNDITDRLNIEATLRQSEQRARDIIDNLFTFVGLLTPEGVMIEANRTALEAASLQPDDVLCKPFKEAYWWAYSPEVQAQLQAAIERAAAGEQSRYDVTIRLAEDQYIIIDFMLAPVFDAQGQVTFLVPSGLDITKRKHAERRLAVEHAVSQVLTEADTLAEAAPHILQAICHNLEVDVAELWLPETEGQTLRCTAFYTEHMSAAARNFAEASRRQAFKPGQGLPGQVWKQQKPVWVADINQDTEFIRLEAALALDLRVGFAFPIIGGNACLGVLSFFSRQMLKPESLLTNMMASLGRVVGQFVQRTRAEAALRRSHNMLEQRVAERTAELERSMGELDQFAYVASHDLKAPLRAIQHLANWITEDAGELLPEPSQIHLQKMHIRINRMQQLLDDLLAYSRVGRYYKETSAVDTGALVKEVIDLLGPPAGFTFHVQPDMPRLMAHRVPLELVFRNLLQNAVKHHHQATGHIQITARELEEFVEFSVQDDGPGIDPIYQARIFQLFQSLHR